MLIDGGHALWEDQWKGGWLVMEGSERRRGGKTRARSGGALCCETRLLGVTLAASVTCFHRLPHTAQGGCWMNITAVRTCSRTPSCRDTRTIYIDVLAGGWTLLRQCRLARMPPIVHARPFTCHLWQGALRHDKTLARGTANLASSHWQQDARVRPTGRGLRSYNADIRDRNRWQFAWTLLAVGERSDLSRAQCSIMYF